MDRPLLIVDGDNVAHARWRGRRGRRDVPAMRAGLVEDVAGYAARVGLDAIVVFDGAGEAARVGAVEVLHSGPGEIADTVIERLAVRRADVQAVIVATADRELRSVAGAHAAVIGPGELLRRVAAAAGDDAAPGAGAERRYRLADSQPDDVRARLERLRRRHPR